MKLRMFEKLLMAWLLGWIIVLSAYGLAFAEVPVYNYDGDTIKFSPTLIVRLAHIDAPELLQEGGKESRDILASLIAGQNVTISYQYTGSGAKLKDARGRRYIATILLGDEDVGLTMVRQGWAFLDANCANPDYIQALAYAKEHKKGFWGWENVPECPAEFRKKLLLRYGGR